MASWCLGQCMDCLVVGITHICLKWTPSKKCFDSKVQTIRDGLDRPAATSDYVVDNLQTASLKYHLTSLDEAFLNEIQRVIMRSPSKTCGLDLIPTQILKENIESFASTITRIVNLSMSAGTVSSSLQRPLVTQLLNKSLLDHNTLKNYRPVSNLAFVSKVLERVVLTRLMNHLESTDQHEPHQSAYRPCHSTETFVRGSNDILTAMDKKQGTMIVLLDLSAAFDTIDHVLMLDRLSHIGVRGTAHKWFSSYLGKPIPVW